MRSYGLEYAQTLGTAYEFADRLEEFVDHDEHIPHALIAVGIGCWEKYVVGKDVVDFLKEQIEEIECQREANSRFLVTGDYNYSREICIE